MFCIQNPPTYRGINHQNYECQPIVVEKQAHYRINSFRSKVPGQHVGIDNSGSSVWN